MWAYPYAYVCVCVDCTDFQSTPIVAYTHTSRNFVIVLVLVPVLYCLLLHQMQWKHYSRLCTYACTVHIQTHTPNSSPPATHPFMCVNAENTLHTHALRPKHISIVKPNIFISNAHTQAYNGVCRCRISECFFGRFVRKIRVKTAQNPKLSLSLFRYRNITYRMWIESHRCTWLAKNGFFPLYSILYYPSHLILRPFCMFHRVFSIGKCSDDI